MQFSALLVLLLTPLFLTFPARAQTIQRGPNPDTTLLPNDFSIPTVNSFTRVPGCYVAAYSRTAENSAYAVGGGVYVMGLVRVPGHYAGSICLPAGYETEDISRLDIFKDLLDYSLPTACENRSCWAGGDTGGLLGVP